MTITEIKNSVEKLSTDEQEELFAWIDEFRETQWDQEIAADFQAGKLDHLIAAAKKEFREGKCQKL
ncbi:MAG TPA: hypothetical protein V6C58_06845 [Allocoleopsis sp.]